MAYISLVILPAIRCVRKIQLIALLNGLNHNTANHHLQLVRKGLLNSVNILSYSREIEVDESYFGAQRIRGKRGHGVYVRSHGFGILQRRARSIQE